MEAVDLGLPSGTKWANMNVGAEKPEDYGGYYAWGETEEKDVYDWSTYIHSDGSSQYCNDIGSDIAGTQYDVAHVKWGGSWKMPTLEQIQELLDNCTYEWTTLNGINGGKFTGSNGNSVFVPAAGYHPESSFLFVEQHGGFWSSTFIGNNPYGRAYTLEFNSNNAYLEQWGSLCHGRLVRPVDASTTTGMNVEINDGLVAYYPFNGNANDESGNGNNGTPMENVTLTTGVHGEANGAYQFGGTDNPGNIHVPNSESLQIGDEWSFAAYVKPMSIAGMGGWGVPEDLGSFCIMGKSHDQHGVSIKYEYPTDESFHVCLTAWGWDDVRTTDNSGSHLGKWTHIAITKSGNNYKTFINGVMLKEVETEHDYSRANSEDMYFGKYNDSWYPMNGVLDEVRIYNRTLSDSEVRQLAKDAE